MNELTVSVRKLTDEELMREACESTFLGTSKATLAGMYKAEHSPIRTQMFWITLRNVKLFVSTHLIRHHVGSVPFQLSCRDDRRGGNPGMPDKCDSIIAKLNHAAASMPDDPAQANALIMECVNDISWLSGNADRNTPVTLSLLVNAQSLIDMAKLRLCNNAHEETQYTFLKIKQEIAKIDPDLAAMMVRKCVYRGGLCGEPHCCRFNRTLAFKNELSEYLRCFGSEQIGFVNSEKGGYSYGVRESNQA